MSLIRFLFGNKRKGRYKGCKRRIARKESKMRNNLKDKIKKRDQRKLQLIKFIKNNHQDQKDHLKMKIF